MIPILVLPLLMTNVVARPQVGDPAPAFSAKTLAGSEVREDTLRGHATVVDFFATWCGPCKEGLADLLAIREKQGTRWALVIVVVEGDSPALKDFLSGYPLPTGTTVALDGDGALARAFGEDRLPTTFFLDEKATIRHINRGHGAGFRARATRWLGNSH
jgi:thiol-disulfide isomerase/thioredoxin